MGRWDIRQGMLYINCNGLWSVIKVKGAPNTYRWKCLWTSEKRLVNAPQACKSNTKKLDTNNFSNKNVSSNFSATLNSIPNERGFKMAFLNIVSLPGSKNIDLIAFNET